MNYGVESGLPEPVVKAVVEEAPGRFLLGTYGKGIARLEDGRISRLFDAEGKKFGSYVQCILVDRKGSTWLGTFQSGLQVITGSERRLIPRSNNGGPHIKSVFQGSQRPPWVRAQKNTALFFQW